MFFLNLSDICVISALVSHVLPQPIRYMCYFCFSVTCSSSAYQIYVLFLLQCHMFFLNLSDICVISALVSHVLPRPIRSMCYFCFSVTCSSSAYQIYVLFLLQCHMFFLGLSGLCVISALVSHVLPRPIRYMCYFCFGVTCSSSAYQIYVLFLLWCHMFFLVLSGLCVISALVSHVLPRPIRYMCYFCFGVTCSSSSYQVYVLFLLQCHMFFLGLSDICVISALVSHVLPRPIRSMCYFCFSVTCSSSAYQIYVLFLLWCHMFFLGLSDICVISALVSHVLPRPIRYMCYFCFSVTCSSTAYQVYVLFLLQCHMFFLSLSDVSVISAVVSQVLPRPIRCMCYFCFGVTCSSSAYQIYVLFLLWCHMFFLGLSDMCYFCFSVTCSSSAYQVYVLFLLQCHMFFLSLSDVSVISAVVSQVLPRPIRCMCYFCCSVTCSYSAYQMYLLFLLYCQMLFLHQSNVCVISAVVSHVLPRAIRCICYFCCTVTCSFSIIQMYVLFLLQCHMFFLGLSGLCVISALVSHVLPRPIRSMCYFCFSVTCSSSAYQMYLLFLLQCHMFFLNLSDICVISAEVSHVLPRPIRYMCYFCFSVTCSSSAYQVYVLFLLQCHMFFLGLSDICVISALVSHVLPRPIRSMCYFCFSVTCSSSAYQVYVLFLLQCHMFFLGLSGLSVISALVSHVLPRPIRSMCYFCFSVTCSSSAYQVYVLFLLQCHMFFLGLSGLCVISALVSHVLPQPIRCICYFCCCVTSSSSAYQMYVLFLCSVTCSFSAYQMYLLFLLYCHMFFLNHSNVCVISAVVSHVLPWPIRCMN